MQFDMVIPAAEFTEQELKIISPVTLQVEVESQEGAVKETFTTDSDQTMYQFTSRLEAGDLVKVTLLPGQVAPFYPVVQAL